jgi:hypothetical protein
MITEDDSGPAFPTRIEVLDPRAGGFYTMHGMTLRDYFAAKAMQGFLSDPQLDQPNQWYAETAYKIADAMLEARKVKS